MISELREQLKAAEHLAEMRGRQYLDSQKKLDVIGHESGMMAGLLNDICRYHEECTHNDQMHALIPMEYVSAINDFVARDVDGDNPCPLTDAFLNYFRAEGIHFATSRILAAWKSCLIKATPAEASDVSGAVLSALEFLPKASPEEFKRDYADQVRADIAELLRAAEDGD